MYTCKPTKVKIKCSPSASVPQRKSDGAAAYDLYASEDRSLFPGIVTTVPTGIQMEIPQGWKGEITSRSGLASRGIFVANQPGKIDSDYRGEIKVILYNTNKWEKQIRKGDRIAQFEIHPVYGIEWHTGTLSETDRGDGGFGSTGISDDAGG